MTVLDQPALDAGSAAVNDGQRLFEIFKRGRYRSIKHDSYFQVYERVLGRYVGQPITFVEVGVLNGGSLFMWREYFGPQARIIGIDLNPEALRWEDDGFEIYIGSQSSPLFWQKFYAEVGPVDVMLDDGGHTNEQQIVTTLEALPRLRDGGVLIVEDVHASYMREYDNPSPYSFINFSKFVVDSINRRSGQLEPTRADYWRRVFSLEFYESIVVMNIDSARCFTGRWVENAGVSFGARDFRFEDRSDPVHAWEHRFRFLNRVILLKSIKKRVLRFVKFLVKRSRDAAMARHFR